MAHNLTCTYKKENKYTNFDNIPVGRFFVSKDNIASGNERLFIKINSEDAMVVEDSKGYYEIGYTFKPVEKEREKFMEVDVDITAYIKQ